MTKEVTMTAAQYKRIRERLKLSNYALRRVIGVSLRQAQRYEAGEQAISPTVARLMLMFERYGVPKDFQ
jgi:transcriptional regulator with XRE-family HTH domain